MTSAFDSMFAGANSQLESHLEETITQYRAGADVGVSVTAVVFRPDPTLRTVHGSESLQSLTLQVDSTIPCTHSDRWSIDGLVFETANVGLLDAGWRQVTLTRRYKESQGDVSPGVL